MSKLSTRLNITNICHAFATPDIKALILLLQLLFHAKLNDDEKMSGVSLECKRVEPNHPITQSLKKR